VVLAKKVDAGSVSAPKPVVDLTAGKYNYAVKLEMGGQSMNMKVSTAIEDAGKTWTAVDQMDTPQGSAIDTATIEKGSLLVQKRILKQGPVAVDIDFADNRATGRMSMNGQEKPINAELGGPLFGDAAGGDFAIACLPLAEGYTATFRNFDVQSQKVKLEQLTVAGAESVTVPAGTFDAWRVEITAADGGADKKAVWVAKDSHKVVKVKSTIAAMGGAVMTQELEE
jgi:Protein of unknown function (DUF3108)